MECWVHYDTILDDDQANQRLKEAWEHDDSKDELNVDLQSRTALLVRNRSGTTRML